MKAGHNKTQSLFNVAVQALANEVAKYRLPVGSPDYNIHGPAVAKAHSLYNTAARLHRINPKDPGISALLERTHLLVSQAMDAAYPATFTDDCRRLRQGDSAGMEGAVRFLEADPMYFRAGYVKAWLIRRIKPPMLTPEHVARLQRVVLHVVDTRDDRDFRAFCRLARKVDGPELRATLDLRGSASDPDVRRRARWVLEALGH